MAENLNPTLDLEQILATLASLHNPEDNPDANIQYSTDSYHGNHPLSHLPLSFPPAQQHISNATQDPRLARRPATQQSSTPKPQAQSQAPNIDPSTITEWKQGLRCVTKIASQNSEFAASIRKLMKEQENNVKQWEAGRERLIGGQKVKKENEQTHRAALSLPGLLQDTPLLRTPEREREELDQYDVKVYRATKAMTVSQSQALKFLGVPFFGVKPYLILHESEDAPSTISNDERAGTGNNPKVTPKQLLELQRKMLNHLVEMYGD